MADKENNVNGLNENTDPAEVSVKKADKKPEPKKKPGFGARVARWGREMRSELKKVVWPSPKATINNSGVVIGMIMIVGVFIWLFDLLALRAVMWLMGLFGRSTTTAQG